MKTYVITLSKNFQSKHSKAGEPTGFRDKFLSKQKIHTIRENYPLWKKRIDEVARGEAVLSVRQWSDKPYRSHQETLAVLTKNDGVGIQKLNFGWRGNVQVPIIEGWYCDGVCGGKAELAQNDGLNLDDWQDWFKNHKNDGVYSEPLAIIHFTPFRY